MSDGLAVERDRVVQLHYTIRDEDGAAVEQSHADEPLAILHGHGNVLPAIEQALVGRHAGDRLEVTLAPADAFGERRPDWTQRVSKKYVPNAARLRPGMSIRLQTDQGPRPVTVVKVGGKVVDVDLNHPLAGRTLTFAIEVIGVREASAEELEHRHVHGPGGHHH
ncbi:MAG: peptidylprolyl isomerase [Pseudomonadales bacterium]|nr:peptidylprolyl isomerase [Pseudomonadales bacterium]